MQVVLPMHAQAQRKTQSPLPVTAAQEDDGVTVRVGDQLFTRYLIADVARPLLWPVIGPTGKAMTRSYPVGEHQPGEAQDHYHHQSIWFGYEGLNGYNYWHVPSPGGRRPRHIGKVVHRDFATIGSEANTALIVAHNDWLSGDDELVCKDQRTLRFAASDNYRWIDYQIELIASEGPLEIGDSKEGVFAIRVASSMKADAGLGGQFVLSSGLKGNPAWGQRAAWCDYHGPVEGETLGIAILAHPESFQPLPRWHVRSYGLFAANPFGELAFTGTDKPVSARPAVTTVAQGDSLTLHYRVILHRGDEQQADIAGHFAEFAGE